MVWGGAAALCVFLSTLKTDEYGYSGREQVPIAAAGFFVFLAVCFAFVSCLTFAVGLFRVGAAADRVLEHEGLGDVGATASAVLGGDAQGQSGGVHETDVVGRADAGE